MAGLVGKSIASAYKSILRIDDDSNGIDTSVESVTDGEGTKSCLKLSDDNMIVSPQNDDGVSMFRVATKDNTAILTVDTINNAVKAGAGSVNVLTQYAYFGVDNSGSAQYDANTHYPIPFSNMAISGALADVDFGTGTYSDDTFTTADTDTQYASQIVPMMWYVPDNITIDSVHSIQGADTATGDTTRMHLKSFTFNNGSTSCLSAGELLAHNADQVNAGNEQAYFHTWTIDEASVTGGKVILAFFRSDSVNSDYSCQAIIKYHIT